MITRVLLFFCFLISSGLYSQKLLHPVVADISDKMNCPAERYTATQLQADTEYRFELQTGSAFSCFGIGWKTEENADIPASLFAFRYRTRLSGKEWSDWLNGDADFTPKEIPSGHYRTDAWFTHDATSHQEIEIIFSAPVPITEVILDIFDGNAFKESSIEGPVQVTKSTRAECPEFPSIIARSQWCGGSAPCGSVLAGYTPTTISPTHVVMHHGASPNTYTDGQAVVRSYWNYHVNSNGWSDIGYNYLIDKYGNLYQGRHNPNLPTTDVRAAHAGSANSGSIGINFLGNLDVSIATTAQLQKLYELLAWWFDYRGINILGSSGMTTQTNGWQIQPHFTTHNAIGSTSCPGSDMISRMQSIREATQAIIDNCSDNIPPSTVASTNYDWRGADFYVDFQDEDNTNGSGIDERYVQVLHYNGNEWRAKASSGQFNDNFDNSIHSDWTISSGTWSIASNKILQSNQSTSNSNLYASLTQDNTQAYMYQWQMKLSGTGTNRRGGLHFFADNAVLTNRGNSYLAWFRADDNAFQLYRVENDVLYTVVNTPVTINANTTYDCTVTYDPATGAIRAFLNNELVGEYIDSNPFQSGQYISLRNGNSTMEADNLKVRTSRGDELFVTVGASSGNQALYESPTPSQDACRINTVVKDVTNNWSPQYAKNIYIDWTPPQTQIGSTSTIASGDIVVNFTDTDNTNGSGVERRFYSVADYNGSQWRSNTNRGYFTEPFDNQIHTDWTAHTGSWSIVNNKLVQSDENSNNTNIYASLNQTLSNRYLYSFDLTIDGTGTNRRAGFHYFCDDPDTENRGNSYFIWFRVESQRLEFYRVQNNVFSQEKVIPCNFAGGTTYKTDVVYDRITGETFVYLNNKLVGEWQDPNPISSGNYISFRSGHSKMTIDNFRTFRTRYPSATLTTGTMQSDLRYESISSATGRVSSVVIDSAHNLSSVAQEDLFVTWSGFFLTAGEEEMSAFDVNIYPNPSNGDVTVEINSDTPEAASLLLFDTKGTLVFEKQEAVRSGNNTILLPLESNLPKGMYYLIVQTSSKKMTFKLIRE